MEEQGFTAIALETGLNESQRLQDFVAGGPSDAKAVARAGFTWGFGRYPENIELLKWIRPYNLDPDHRRKISLYGIDVSGGDADGEWARARITLDTALAFMARSALAGSDHVAAEIAPFLDRFSAAAYRGMSKGERAKLRRAIGNLLAAFDSKRVRLVGATSAKDFAQARQNVVAAQQLQNLFDVSGLPDPEGRLRPGDYRADAARDAAMATNALWALGQEGPYGRVLVFAHNGHVMNARSRGGIWAIYAKAPAAMGVHLRRALGRDLVIMGASAPTRGEGTGGPGAIDLALASLGLEHFLLDIRTPSDAASRWLKREKTMSVNYTTESLVRLDEAFDLLLFFDRLTRSKRED